MRNERTAQDKMWDTESDKKDVLVTVTNQQQLTAQMTKYTGGQ